MTKKKPVKSQEFFSYFRLNESYISLLLGVLVVFIIALVGFSLLRITKVQNADKEVSSTRTVLSVPEVLNSNLLEKYTVMSGDSLWTISEKVYGSGYNWTDIAKANNISNPGLIFVGQQLNIPNVKPIIPGDEIAPQVITTQAEGAILLDTYTVVKGDNLWSIAVRAYGDGFRYPEIVKANNLENPSLIFLGNVFKIPRQFSY